MAHPNGNVETVTSTEGHVLRLLFWETTAACNLACVHCRRLDTAAEMARQDMTGEQALGLVDAIRRTGQPILVLSGGEPLTRPDIFDIAEHAHQTGLTVALATNGTLVDEAMAERIVASGIRRVAISIDGADAATHDDFRRQPGALAEALAGFERLRTRGMSMQINCTVTRHNAHQVDAIYDLAAERRADALHLFMLVPVGCGEQIAETNMLSAGNYEAVLRWLYRKSTAGPLEVKATCAPHYYRIAQQQARKEGRQLEAKTHGMAAMTRGCLAGTGVCFVSHTGEVFPCGYLPVSAGNVLKQPLETIWRDAEVFGQLRDPKSLQGKCGVCEYTGICGGCRARAYYETGDYLAEEPYCAWQPGEQ